MHEWALVIFTILAPMSVGAFVVLGVVHLWAMDTYGVDKADRLSERALLAIGPTLALGFVASLFHLGHPLAAYRAVFNVGSSWLSREIALGIAFAVLGGLFALLQWRKFGSFEARNVVAVAAAVVGLGLIYAMARVYMLPSQPAWNTWATPVSFYLTAFLLGTLALGAAFMASYVDLRQQNRIVAASDMDMVRAALRGLAVAAIVLMGLQFIAAPLSVASLASGSDAAVASAALLITQYRWLFALQLGLLFLGAGLFSLGLFRSAMRGAEAWVLRDLAYLAFILALVGELLGRYVFYAAHVKIGL